MPARKSHWLFILLIASLVSGCVRTAATPRIENPNATRTPFRPVPDAILTGQITPAQTLPEPTPEQPAATQEPPAAQPPDETQPAIATRDRSLWIDPAMPAALRAQVHLPEGWTLSDGQESAAVRLEPGYDFPISRWVYALAAPFPTLTDQVSLDELQRTWRGESSGPFAGRPLLTDESTAGVFSVLWGTPAPGAIQIISSDNLLQTAWEQPPSWALISFEAIEPRWKILQVDGISPLSKFFDAQAYALSVPISLAGDVGQIDSLLSLAEPLLPSSNRDPGRLSVVAMTGVTALVRATAFTMEQRGVLYPGKDVRDWLLSADITHISNEVPFAKDCPYPDPVQADMRFCSDPRYIALLEDVDADLIELTGDHFQDWGNQAMLLTLDMYHERGWLTYGGGANLQEARQPALFEHNGNRLAFLGCNAKGGGYAQAAPDHPGALACDLAWLEAEVARLRQEGYLPIVTFQHFEYYTYPAQANQVRDARRMAEAGAVVVSGSQAHQPQAFEFHSGALIHHGLGNLFFDQYEISPATRQGFIDQHVFYEGRYLGVELQTILFVDYARPRPMDAGERQELLNQVFSASQW